MSRLDGLLSSGEPLESEIQRLLERISELEEFNANLRQLESAIRGNAGLFEALVAKSREGIILTAFDRRIIRIVRSLAGYSPTELSGLPVEQLLHPEDQARAVNCFDRILRRDAAEVFFEARAPFPDGSLHWLAVTLTDLLDEPAIQAIVCNYADITERRMHEIKLSEMAALVEHSPYAIFSKDLAGHVTTWNPGATHTFGYSEAEILGQHVSVLVPAELRHQEREWRDAVRQGRTLKEIATRRLHKSGVPVPVFLTLGPLLQPDGQVRGIFHLSRPAWL